MDPLASSWHKYRWAKKHAQAVDAAFARVFRAHRDSFAFHVDVQQRGDKATATARVAKLPIIDESCLLNLGDAIHNYRTALDHLAWDLVRIGLTPRPRKPREVQFPFADSAKSFSCESRRRLPGVRPDHIAVVRQYQPYRRGEHARALKRLHNLDITDEHRFLIRSVVAADTTVLSVGSNWQFTSAPQGRTDVSLKVGTEVMQVELLRSGTGDCEVYVQGHLPLYPSLGRGLHVGTALKQIDEAVFSLLELFEELF